MPDPSETGTLDEIADALYATRPDDFVPARDDAVARAREQGDRELARAIGRLRRPTKAAWLANLLARHRAEQLDGLLALAGDLADAQRTLDGTTLRALSSQRSRLVSAMAKEAGRLASQAGDSAAESVLRDVSGILEAALADPGVADEVRAGRLTRTVSYSGFGPAAEPGTVPARPRPAPPAAVTPATATPATATPATATAVAPEQSAEQERAEQARAREHAEQAARERAELDRAVADAERAEEQARDRQEADEAAREDTEAEHTDAKARVVALAAELDAARERERTTSADARAAASAARESARAAGAAATVTARARARREESG